MESLYYFIDPAFFSTNNKEDYLKSNIFNAFAEFYNRIVRIEDLLIPEGSKEIIFNFPIKDEIIHDCLTHPPSCDVGLTKMFFKIFNIFYSKYVLSCNMRKPITDINVIYENNLIPHKIEEKFNIFLNSCIKNRNNDCLCNTLNVPTPIYITIKTNVNEPVFLIPFSNPDDLYYKFPYLKFFPKEIEDINDKTRKLEFILNFNFFKRQGRFPEQQYTILDEFWESELLFRCDLKMQEQIINVMTDLIESPHLLKNERKKLNHEIFKINNVKKNLEQCYIFQVYDLNGVKITPRLRFFIHSNTIFFVDIIDRH